MGHFDITVDLVAGFESSNPVDTVADLASIPKRNRMVSISIEFGAVSE